MSLLAGMIRMIYDITWATCLECILFIFFNIFSKIVGIVTSYFKQNVWKIILFKYLPFPRQFQLYHAHTKELRQYSWYHFLLHGEQL